MQCFFDCHCTFALCHANLPTINTTVEGWRQETDNNVAGRPFRAQQATKKVKGKIAVRHFCNEQWKWAQINVENGEMFLTSVRVYSRPRPISTIQLTGKHDRNYDQGL